MDDPTRTSKPYPARRRKSEGRRRWEFDDPANSVFHREANVSPAEKRAENPIRVLRADRRARIERQSLADERLSTIRQLRKIRLRGVCDFDGESRDLIVCEAGRRLR
jgi:hypothetical protein